MTSEEFARVFGRLTLRGVERSTSNTEGYGYKRLFTLGIQRIMFTGADEYEIEPNVQKVEVKPLGDLITDIEEEIVDLVAYCAALQERDPYTMTQMESIAQLAVEMMDIVGEVRGAK